MTSRTFRLLPALVLTLFIGAAQAQTLLNASYDVARELFEAYNQIFIEHWRATTGAEVSIEQSHAGSSTQAQAILQGLRADVVTFNQVTDIDVLHQRGNLIPADWASRLPNNSSPYYSTTAFLVRAGNPKNIQGWADLVREDVSLVFPNPKTSGNGRYTFLAALGYARRTYGDDQAAIDTFLRTFLSRVAVFDTGGRGATTTFVEREIGDVLITFESEVNGTRNTFPDLGFEVVVPAISFYAEFPVAWIDENVRLNGTEDLARAYLEYLYSEEGQRLLATFYYRVNDEAVAAEYAHVFPAVDFVTIEEIAGSWANASAEHFSDGGTVDTLLNP